MSVDRMANLTTTVMPCLRSSLVMPQGIRYDDWVEAGIDLIDVDRRRKTAPLCFTASARAAWRRTTLPRRIGR